jgi:predicted transcriptional regulator
MKDARNYLTSESMPIQDFTGLYLQSPRLNQFHILREVAAESHITQAELAIRCSLSVAMVNNYMKDLYTAGLIEYRRKSSKSITYHLTADGKKQLNVLQCELIRDMGRMFESAKEEIGACISRQASVSLQRVVLYGSGHLAQLVYHALERTGVCIIAICDDDIEAIGNDFCGRVIMNPSQIRFMAPDAVIIVDSGQAETSGHGIGSNLPAGIQIIHLNRINEQKDIALVQNHPESEVAYHISEPDRNAE